MKPHYDAVIVGGGHNGLTCGAYLSRAGVKVLVVERREIIGGAAVTGEIAPGYRSSMASYYQGLLQPKVILDLELQKYGFEVIPAAPTVFALEGGRTFTMWDDPDRFAAEIAKLRDQGVRRLVFMIGGADGLDPALVAQANGKLAFGPQTWPHALARAMLAEQVYRAVTILAGGPYHRD